MTKYDDLKFLADRWNSKDMETFCLMNVDRLRYRLFHEPISKSIEDAHEMIWCLEKFIEVQRDEQGKLYNVFGDDDFYESPDKHSDL